jgi:molybdate transport system substrate-binding protein
MLPAGCGPQGAGGSTAPEPAGRQRSDVIVFAAASLAESFTEIAQMFEQQHPGVKVVCNLAGSQALSAQIGQGAPADVFASASQNEMDNAIRSGRVVAGSQTTFARNKLVVVYPTDNPAGLDKLQDLARPGLKLVFAARQVPVGKYSVEFLNKASEDASFGATFKDDVLTNVASFEDNVKSVLTKVALGEGDAGIVYLSDISLDNAGKVGRFEIPDALNSIATYPIAPVSDAAQPELAQAFIELVLSAQGLEILARHGFLPP